MAYARKRNVKYILDNMVDINDDDIDTIYNKIIEFVPIKVKKKKLNRMDKILHIKSNLIFIENDNLETLKDIVFDAVNYVESEEDKKLRITLEIINKILHANNYPEIKNLTDFVDIKRDIMLSEESINVVNENKEYIFKNGFNKTGCKIYHTYIKSPHLSIIKGMLKEIGYMIKSKMEGKSVNKIREMYMIYTIVKND